MNPSYADPSLACDRQDSQGCADLEKGWLAVVGLDSFDPPDQLGSYSNHCGVAMYYCLAAPGNVIVINYNVT
ncbi:hypothetical protein, partial [Xylella fastidiosa]|uniref:hypothetical protein n=1 Tax=Xylella fastidiosa TaxID=2371 RepID=UPI0013231A8A